MTGFFYSLKASTRSAVLLCCLLFLTTGCGDRPVREVLRGGTMGTTWSVVYGDPQRVSPLQLQAKIDTELQAINAALSTYIPNSEISELNNAPGTVTRPLSEHFATVLELALEVGELTHGAYDISVGPLIDLWGFGAGDFAGEVPSADAIAEAQRQVGAGRLVWDAAARTLKRPAGMRVDFSSIAKGYAVDRLTALLKDEGLENTLVEIGGELRSSGSRPEGGPWRLAVESPDPAEGRFIEALELRDAAVATSGDYRNYFTVDGKRYSHLVDPRSGYPVNHDLVSVTVIAETCMEADAFATALIVLGLDEAIALAETLGLAAHFVSRGEVALEVHYTAAFDAYRHQGDDGSA